MRRLQPSLALLVLALAAGCGSSPAGSATTTSASLVQTSPDAGAPPSAPADGTVQRLAVTVAGSSVTGNTGTVTVKIGHPVQLTVTSDVADEVHVHGADVSKDVTAGGTVTLDFVQQAPGRFEVELEHAKRVLVRLQVS